MNTAAIAARNLEVVGKVTRCRVYEARADALGAIEAEA